MIVDVAVVGAGPAGMAAVIQLCRQGQSVALFESEQRGGLLRNAHRVDNYPGLPAGISGSGLVERMCRQLDGFSHRYVREKVVSLDWDGKMFQLTGQKERLEARRVFIASGTRAKSPQDLTIDRGAGNRVFTEVTDLNSLTGGLISVIGGGDAALDYSLSLAGLNSVKLWCRQLNFKSPAALVSEVLSHSRITVLYGHCIQRIKRSEAGRIELDGSGPDGLAFSDPCSHVVLALGREANIDFIPDALLKKRVRLEEKGLLFFIGDVVNGDYRQIALAVADGVRAAMTVVFLERNIKS